MCRDLGTDAEPIWVECVCCGGEGCDECERGYFRVDGCPGMYCNVMSQVIEITDWINEKHLLPIAGGILDQAQWIMDAARCMRNEDSRARTE